MSDGSPTRTFCYISDAIAGYLKVLTHGMSGEAYNIGVEKPEISMNELAQKIINEGKDLWGYCGRIIYQESKDTNYLIDNPNRRCPNIDKAKKQLDYAPGIDLSEGLKRSLLWYREHQVLEAT